MVGGGRLAPQTGGRWDVGPQNRWEMGGMLRPLPHPLCCLQDAEFDRCYHKVMLYSVNYYSNILMAQIWFNEPQSFI